MLGLLPLINGEPPQLGSASYQGIGLEISPRPCAQPLSVVEASLTTGEVIYSVADDDCDFGGDETQLGQR